MSLKIKKYQLKSKGIFSYIVFQGLDSQNILEMLSLKNNEKILSHKSSINY